MQVRDVLASKGNGQVFTISPDASVADLLDALAEHDVGALLVSADGAALLGIVSERDVVRKLREVEHPRAASVADIMTTDIQVTTSDDSFGSLMTTMTEHRVRHVPVVDDGVLVGVLSIGDAVKHRLDRLTFERDQLDAYVHGGSA